MALARTLELLKRADRADEELHRATTHPQARRLPTVDRAADPWMRFAMARQPHRGPSLA